MSCCREHEIYLNWKPEYNSDVVVNNLMEMFGWTYLQSQIVVETAQRNNKCLLIREGDTRISELSLKMANYGLSFEVSKINLIR